MDEFDYELDEARDAVMSEANAEEVDEDYKPCGCYNGCSYCL